MPTPPHVVRGRLVSVGVDPPITVRFQFNPVSVTDKRSSSFASLTAPGALLPTRQYTTGGDRTISFTVTVDGMSAAAGGPGGHSVELDPDGGIGPELNKYRAFAYPRTPHWAQAADRSDGFTGLYRGQETVFTSPPQVLFAFGDRVIACLVTDLGITETLHSATLAPLRADVSLTLAELNPYQLADDGSLL